MISCASKNKTSGRNARCESNGEAGPCNGNGITMNGMRDISANIRGIVAMLSAVALFSMMDTVMKLLSVRYPAIQVAALRGMSSLPLVAAYVVWRGALASLLRVRWRLHLFRAALGILMLWLFVIGLRLLPLTEAYTLSFIAPLLITALSVLLLKERVDGARWAAVVAGLGGVLVVLRPAGTGLFGPGGLAVLAAASCYAVTAITVRMLARSDSSESMVFWLTLMTAAGAGALAFPGWVAVDGGDWLLLAALAVTGFGGQICITEAFRHGEASAIAPFEYTALAWSAALDWLLWRTLPDGFTLLGAAIIVGSGVVVIERERRLRGRARHSG